MNFVPPAPGIKSLFASFSSEKEESSFLKERSKELLCFGRLSP
jgi:hypothetical protein